jgi:hypothetical protein
MRTQDRGWYLVLTVTFVLNSTQIPAALGITGSSLTEKTSLKYAVSFADFLVPDLLKAGLPGES